MDVVSADSHIQEPNELFDEWLPERFKRLVPRIETRSDGSRYRIVDGRKPRRLDFAESQETDDDQTREFRNDPSGGRDVALRLKDQERDGVIAEVLYPNVSLSLFHSPDLVYQAHVARTYNEWIIDCFRDNLDRFVPVAIVPAGDLPAAIDATERAAAAGFRAIKLPITVPQRPYNNPAYEPLWSLCEEAGLVVSFHAFSNVEDKYPADWGEPTGTGGALNMMAMSMADGMTPVSSLISSGALMRHPALKFVIVECGAGWLAWLLYVLDEQNEKKHMWIQPKLDLKPSEYFLR
ncbi:MAG: amidohydrolase family protein, partial [Chromatiales bacterium]|nr:amidohydrolase family protein [Chromatiales bacterium]